MALRRRVFLWSLLCLVVVSAGCTSVKIEKVLPFTPSVDSVRIETKLADASAAATLTATIAPAGDAKSVIWSGPLQSPTTLLEKLPVNPWSPGQPNLYNLTVTAREEGKRPTSKTVRFGFRQIES